MEFDINSQKDESGIIIAPAGCGKTETITNIIKKYDKVKKILVLTHTNAGVENIEKRIKKHDIPESNCSIYTITSFCSKYVKSFRKLSKITDDSFNQIHIGMNNLLNNKHIKKIIKNTYSFLLVDEYQDCNLIQHSIIKKISNIIDFKIFGDPLQSIYDFKESSVKIDKIINVDYKLLGYMTYPWRWSNNQELGNWIMKSRKEILKGNVNIFTHLPSCVEYFVYKNYVDLQKKVLGFLKLDGRKVVLFDLENQANAFCKKLGGRFYFQEEIQCKALNNITIFLDNNDGINVVKEVINLGKLCFTNFITELGNIIKKVESNDFDLSKINKNKNVAVVIMNLVSNFNLSDVLQLMKEISSNANLKLYRKELWTVLEILINEFNKKREISSKELLVNIRNSKILNNKFKYNNMVSRILLVKGLEFENVFLVNPNDLTPELLYVAISRPTKKLIIAQKIEK